MAVNILNNMERFTVKKIKKFYKWIIIYWLWNSVPDTGIPGHICNKLHCGKLEYWWRTWWNKFKIRFNCIDNGGQSLNGMCRALARKSLSKHTRDKKRTTSFRIHPTYHDRTWSQGCLQVWISLALCPFHTGLRLKYDRVTAKKCKSRHEM